MKAIFSLALLAFALSTPAPATAQNRPHVKKAKRAFSHNAESSRGKASKAQFRHESTRPVIDLTPHKSETFKTAKVNKHYKYPKPH